MKLRFLTALALLAVAFTPASVVAAPANVVAAVASSGRSADNRALDASRKPAGVLRFLGLQRGARVLDMFGANHYWAEIFSQAVGPAGRVTVWEPTQFYKGDTKSGFEAFAAKAPNVSIIVSPFEAPALPKNAFDFMLINLNYHDVYWQNAKYGIVRMEPDAWLKAVYASLRPGATVGVVDHVAKAGIDPRVSVEKMHRIDPAVVRADFKRAGFVFAGQSNALRNPADDHSLLVFDDRVKGKTDRFIYRFRKPR